MDAVAALMVRVREGDDGAFAELLGRYRQSAVNFAYRLVQNAAVAEEIAQDAFVNIYHARSRYEPTAKFNTWLFTVVTNLSLKHLQRKRRWLAVSEADEASARKYEDCPSAEKSPLDGMVEREAAVSVRQAVKALPDKERTAIVLHKYHGKSYQDIAAIMKCSLGAVKTHIHRGKLRLCALARGKTAETPPDRGLREVCDEV